MNRAEARRLVRAAKPGDRKAIAKELRRRAKDGWSEPCVFDQHKKCLPGTPCACPHHERSVTNGEGDEVADVKARDSGLYVARSSLRVARPRGGPRVGS